MSLEFFIINPHLVPFLILFFIGAVLLVIAPLHYRWKTKSVSVFLTSKDFVKYNKFQKRSLFFGIIFVMAGILGAAFVSEEYGYNRIVFDIHGNKTIENSKSGTFLSRTKPENEEIPSEVLVGTTIIPGTWDWDIERDKIGGNGKIDLWWSHVNESERYLIPKNGTKISIVSDRSFEDVDENYLKNLPLFEEKISSSDSDPILVPGVVIAVNTAEGNYAKIRVNGFRQLHDFTFKGSEVLKEKWKSFVLNRPNIEKYHLEVEWVLYRGNRGHPILPLSRKK